jgi:hypothetical protein
MHLAMFHKTWLPIAKALFSSLAHLVLISFALPSPTHLRTFFWHVLPSGVRALEESCQCQ